MQNICIKSNKQAKKLVLKRKNFLIQYAARENGGLVWDNVQVVAVETTTINTSNTRVLNKIKTNVKYHGVHDF